MPVIKSLAAFNTDPERATRDLPVLASLPFDERSRIMKAHVDLLFQKDRKIIEGLREQWKGKVALINKSIKEGKSDMTTAHKALLEQYDKIIKMFDYVLDNTPL